MPEWLSLRLRSPRQPSQHPSSQFRSPYMHLQEVIATQKLALSELLEDGGNWVTIKKVYRGENVKATYDRLVSGSGGGIGPDTGMVWSMWDNSDEEKRERGEKSKL